MALVGLAGMCFFAHADGRSLLNPRCGAGLDESRAVSPTIEVRRPSG